MSYVMATVNGRHIRLPVHLIPIAESKRVNYLFRHSVEQGYDIVDCPSFYDESEYVNGYPIASG